MEECRPCPVFASFTLAFALQLRKKQRAFRDISLPGHNCVATLTTQSSSLLYVPGWHTDSDEGHVPGQGVFHVAYTRKLYQPWYYTSCDIHFLQHNSPVKLYRIVFSPLNVFTTQSIHIILCISATGPDKTVWKLALTLRLLMSYIYIWSTHSWSF